MITRRRILGIGLAGGLLGIPANAGAAVVSSLELADVEGSAGWPAPVQKMLRYALSLTKKKLGYQYGSSDPAAGGMDCSGTIWHVLNATGWKGMPRTSRDMHKWLKEAGVLTAVAGTPDLDDAVLAGLRPGDLLFWTGTTSSSGRQEISHVMMYLGRKKDGAPVAFGASDGRSYMGKRQSGVSVFDFKIPKESKKARFVGYGPLPGLDVSKLKPVPPG